MFRTVNHIRTIALFLALGVLLIACNLGTPQATPVPTPDIPTVQILAPPNNAQVIDGTVFDIDILAEDASQGVDKVELYVDGALINNSNVSGTVPRYRVTMNWLAQGEGFHVVSAIAYRDEGTRSDESIINIEVIPRN